MNQWMGSPNSGRVSILVFSFRKKRVQMTGVGKFAKLLAGGHSHGFLESLVTQITLETNLDHSVSLPVSREFTQSSC